MSSDLPVALALAASSDDRMREVSLGDTGGRKSLRPSKNVSLRLQFSLLLSQLADSEEP